MMPTLHPPFMRDRRTWLHQALFGSALLGLRAAVSGIPRQALAQPGQFTAPLSPQEAAERISASAAAQYLVLGASDAGEPMNCNVPGMYLGQGFRHPTAPSMAETTFALGNTRVVAAKAWSTLRAANLNRSTFFHHATYSFAHGDLSNVHKLNGGMATNDLMVSSFAQALQEPLGTIQPQPIVISNAYGAELVSYAGSQQPMFSPLAIRDLLTTPQALSAYSKTQSLRDKDLDAFNALAKTKGTAAQRALLDSWANTQTQARSLPQALLGQLSAIKDNSVGSQMIVASILCQLKITPAVVVHVPFGGDNHIDNNSHDGPGALPGEAAQHGTGVAAINALTDALTANAMADNVTFATLSTFGRTNAGADLSGRAHNGQHTCNLILGAHANPGVVGGATLVGDSPRALAIDAQTGAGVAGGSIAYEETLASYGRTLGRTLGIAEAALASMIPTGTSVLSAIA